MNKYTITLRENDPLDGELLEVIEFEAPCLSHKWIKILRLALDKGIHRDIRATIERNDEYIGSASYYYDTFSAWLLCISTAGTTSRSPERRDNMDHDTLLTKLRREVEYAWNSYSLPLVYQTHGKVCMAADLGAITYPEFCELDTKLIREGLNNPKWFNDPRFHMV